MTIPSQWSNSDFTKQDIRLAFSDWLEDKGDWRAEEIKRLSIIGERKGADNQVFAYKTTVYSGPFIIHEQDDPPEKVVRLVIGSLFNEAPWYLIEDILQPDQWIDKLDK